MREIKQAQIERRTKRRRGIRRGALFVVVAGAVIGIVFALSSSSPKPKKAAVTTTSTTSPTSSSTTTSPTSSSTTTSPTISSTTTTLPGTPTTAPVSHTAIAPTCPPATPAGAPTRVIAFTKAPPLCIAKTGVYDATVKTDVGTFVIRMDAAASLAGVNNFVFLARYHFYDGLVFQRVIKGFVVQGGDPTETGAGGPGYSFTGNTPPASCTKQHDCYPTGAVAYANSGSPSSDGSQFFIVLPGGGGQLAPNYTRFGQVISGMSVVERIGADGAPSTDQQGTPRVLHHMVKVTITQVG